MEPVRDAVLIAAGLGTRMLPVSAYLSKESLPLVDVPLLTHLILEAKQAGVSRLHVVTSPSKSFDSLLNDRRQMQTHRPEMDSTLFNVTDGLEVLVHIQEQPKGVGNAIEAALDAIDGPFLVMLGDNLLMDVHATATAYIPSSASKRLVEAFMENGSATVGLAEVEPSSLQHYGVVAMDGCRIVEVVEKPEPEQAPSRLAMCGRYVFPAETQRLLKTYDHGTHGELQSIALLEHWMREGSLHGLVLEHTQWYDSGAPLLWLKAQIDHALRRSDFGDELTDWLERRLSD